MVILLRFDAILSGKTYELIPSAYRINHLKRRFEYAECKSSIPVNCQLKTESV